MELEKYNQLFDEQVKSLEKDANIKLRAYRQQSVKNFINKIIKHQREWEIEFNDLLSRSQQDIQVRPKTPELALYIEPPTEPIKDDTPPHEPIEEDKPPEEPIKESKKETNNNDVISSCHDYRDPFPKELSDYFTSDRLVKESIEIMQQLEMNRQQFSEIHTHPALKQYKTDINLFIRTQINSISNMDQNHLRQKIRMLSNFLLGHPVNFQGRNIQVNHHQLYAMDLAAQTFVTVGTRLVNSVPAIAKSMASVINGIIIENNLQHFRHFILGNLQERCPYLIPIYPERMECDEKDISRMRSMALIFSSILAQHHDKSLAWSWLAGFLSHKPEPVITATVLQAYLQGISKPMSQAFGRQYKKMLHFIRTDYMRMIEDATPKAERQSLIKLKNFLADDSDLIATPTMSQLFRNTSHG